MQPYIGTRYVTYCVFTGFTVSNTVYNLYVSCMVYLGPQSGGRRTLVSPNFLGQVFSLLCAGTCTGMVLLLHIEANFQPGPFHPHFSQLCMADAFMASQTSAMAHNYFVPIATMYQQVKGETTRTRRERGCRRGVLMRTFLMRCDIRHRKRSVTDIRGGGRNRKRLYDAVWRAIQNITEGSVPNICESIPLLIKIPFTIRLVD